MIEKTVEIINNAGLHTRPAATIVKIAAKFKSEFFINKDGMHINGKSIIGVMTLAAEKGSSLILSFAAGVKISLPEISNLLIPFRIRL